MRKRPHGRVTSIWTVYDWNTGAAQFGYQRFGVVRLVAKNILKYENNEL
jgi:hypothetical protein